MQIYKINYCIDTLLYNCYIITYIISMGRYKIMNFKKNSKLFSFQYKQYTVQYRT